MSKKVQHLQRRVEKSFERWNEGQRVCNANQCHQNCCLSEGSFDLQYLSRAQEEEFDRQQEHPDCHQIELVVHPIGHPSHHGRSYRVCGRQNQEDQAHKSRLHANGSQLGFHGWIEETDELSDNNYDQSINNDFVKCYEFEIGSHGIFDHHAV